MSELGRIALNLRFHPLARRPDKRRLGRRWDIVVNVDGVEHIFEEAPRCELEGPPGRHEVEVYFRAAGILIVAKALGIRYGREHILVDVPEGGEVQLEYRGGMFWTLGGRSLRQMS